MQTTPLRKLLKALGFEELAEHEGHVLLRSEKSQVVLPIRETLKPSALRRFESFSIRGTELAPPVAYPPEARFAVKLEEVEDQHWLATVPARPGCMTQAKTLSKAVERIHDALRLYDSETPSFELEVSVDLPIVHDGLAAIAEARGGIDAAHGKVEEARGKVEEAQQRVEEALALVEKAEAKVAEAEAGVGAAQAGIGEAEEALQDRTRQVVERLMLSGFDARDAALLLGKTPREISRLLKSGERRAR